MHSQSITGAGIGIAVLDTGIYPHIDFDRRIIAFRDFTARHSLIPYDDNGHGTHVAGIIAGSGKSSRGRYCGKAPGSHLICAKILDKQGNGIAKNVVEALQWICSLKAKYNIRIINISIGATGNSAKTASILIRAVEEAWDKGLIVVTAAGNMGPSPGSVTAPGSSRKVITVGSSDLLDACKGISGCGPTEDCICKPDLVMPGAGIIACSSSGSYAAKSGTSMSTPQVSGIIALLLEQEPELTNVEVKMRLKYACRSLGYPRNRQGWGQLDENLLLSSSK